MRDRKEIEKKLEWLFIDGTDYAKAKYPLLIISELLLDIRDLFNKPKEDV